ncbi:MAG: hypothetical protein QRY72_05675 [Candidatus Rhabdochlamydia sp.]
MNISIPRLTLSSYQMQAALLEAGQKIAPLCNQHWGKLSSGILLGLSLVTLIDHYFHRQCEQIITTYYKSLRAQKDDHAFVTSPTLAPYFKRRDYLLSAVLVIAPLCLTAALQRTWKIQSLWNFTLPVMIGVWVGKKIFNLSHYYLGITSQRVINFIKEYLIQTNDEAIHLSHLQGYFPTIHLKKMNTYLREHRSEFTHLDLVDCHLTDNDLKKLSQSGLLQGVSSIDLSQNPCISAAGLKWIGMKTKDHLETLILKHSHLNDRDLALLEQGEFFNTLKQIVLDQSLQITGNGLASLGKEGFKSLEILKINQIRDQFRHGFQEWLKASYPSLKRLDMDDSAVTMNDFSQMMHHAAWFSKLSHLSMSQHQVLIANDFNSKLLSFLQSGQIAITTIVPFMQNNPF